jgi:transcriptional regulator NrdR family protein
MKKITILLIILTIVLSIINLKSCTENSKLKKQNQYTMKVLLDEVRVTKNKNDELEFRQLTLMTDLKSLSNTNSVLNDDINKLTKKEQKNLLDITKLKIEVNNLKDSIKELDMTQIAISDSVNRYQFIYKNEFRELIGYTDVNSILKPNDVKTFITTDKTFLNLTINKVKTKDGVEIIVSSTNPSVNIGKIDGAILNYADLVGNKKRLKYSINLSIGYSLGVNPFNSQLYLGPTIGLGLGYNIINF